MFPRYGVVKGKGPTANRDMRALYERTPPRDLHGWTEMMLGQNRVRVLGVHGGCGGGRISPRAESPKNDARSVVALVGSDGLSEPLVWRLRFNDFCNSTLQYQTQHAASTGACHCHRVSDYRQLSRSPRHLIFAPIVASPPSEPWLPHPPKAASCR